MTRKFLSTQGYSLALRLALRELRGGVRGFWILIGCIALGVAAIGGVNAVSQSITQGIEGEGQTILGGDVAASLVQRELTPEQIAFFSTQGELSRQITMRTMGRLSDGSDQTLVELKAIDGKYPLYGSFTDATGNDIKLDFGQIAVDAILLERLNLHTHDELQIGSQMFEIAYIIGNEPDRIGDNFGFGPKVLIRDKDLEKTGLVQPGSLLRYHYKLKLNQPSHNQVESLITNAKETYPDAGWRIRSRANAAPALTRNLDRFSQFLTLVGLTSLVVGGVGVANATRAFLETKRPVIATLKSVGASGKLVFNIYLIQIMVMASLGVALGILLALAMPPLAAWGLSGFLPLPAKSGFFPFAIGLGAFYGILTALIFAIWPLAISRDIKPTELFRANSYGLSSRLPRAGYIIALIVLTGLLIFCAIQFSGNRFIAGVFVAAIGFSFILLRGVAFVIQWLARHAPSSRSAIIRMAIANIHRPGSLTSSVVLSLGLGLALLVALATIDGNLRNQIENNLPDEAPDFFFVDVQNHEIDAFRNTLLQQNENAKIIAVPMLRGRVVSLKGIDTSEYKVANGGEWVLRGDRGITYAKNVPENSTLSEGEWWSPDYDGPPLVSVTAEEASELGLSLGDKVVINVLGRNIEASIASFREVQWETLGINFVFVFSPNTFANAPHSWLTTLTTSKKADTESDGDLLRTLSKQFPTVTAVRIRDALETINGLIGQLSAAIRAAALVALLSSILVLAGALAAGNRERVHDAVVLKTLGATRPRLFTMMIIEYAVLGLATAIFALAAGSLAGWFVISIIMGFEFVVLPMISFLTVITALGLTIVFGLSGTWHILGQKASPYLREL